MRGLLVDQIPNSPNQNSDDCMAEGKENYGGLFVTERVKSPSWIKVKFHVADQ